MTKSGKSTKHETAIVFGGSGFLGSHVCDALADRGYKVKVFDLKPSCYLRDGQAMVVGDILDRKMVFKAMEGCNYVYNFAGISDLDDAKTKPLDTVQLNLIGNLNIMDAALKAKAKRYIYASTIYVYSEKGGFYRCSKQASELYIEEYQRHFGLNFTILRYGTLYGPRADQRNSIHKYLTEALRHQTITCSSTAGGVRDYVYVRDAANLSVDILAPAFNHKHIIISGLHPIKFNEMILIIQEILGKKIKIRATTEKNAFHYEYTPYSFVPKIGSKLTSHLYTDMGQGLLECLHEISELSPRRDYSGERTK